jgi:CRP/FNR family cyclic AMP-dependent transcriptional regulator
MRHVPQDVHGSGRWSASRSVSMLGPPQSPPRCSAIAKDQKLELLSGVPLFSALGRGDLQRVGQLTDVLDYRAGRMLMQEGQTGAEAMILVTGRASVTQAGKVITEVGPGAVVGEMALLSGRPRSATVTLVTDAEVLVLARREFQALLNEMPAVRAQVMETMALRLMAALGDPTM